MVDFPEAPQLHRNAFVKRKLLSAQILGGWFSPKINSSICNAVRLTCLAGLNWESGSWLAKCSVVVVAETGPHCSQEVLTSKLQLEGANYQATARRCQLPTDLHYTCTSIRLAGLL